MTRSDRAHDARAYEIGRDQPIVENLQHGVLSHPVDVPAGTYEVKVLLHDTGQLVLAIPEVTIAPGTIYDVVAYGTPGNEQAPLTAAVLKDTPWSAVPSATPEATVPSAIPTARRGPPLCDGSTLYRDSR
jgi:hypothetical protein